MVRRAEDYPYSSHRAYLGLAPAGITDVDPVLRHFGAKKERGRENFAQFVAAGRNMGYRPDLYSPPKGILGSEEFDDAAIHRLGDTGHVPRPPDGRLHRTPGDLDSDALIAAVEQVNSISRDDFCGRSKAIKLIMAKEALIVAGRRLGANITTLAAIADLSVGSVSRRHDSGLRRAREDENFRKTISQVVEVYNNIGNQ